MISEMELELIRDVYSEYKINEITITEYWDKKKWLEEQVEKFNLSDLEQDFAETDWGKILLKDIEEEVIDCQSILQEEIKKLKQYPELDKYSLTITNDIEQLEMLRANLNSWEKAYTISQNLEFITWPRSSKITLEAKENAKNARDNVKKKLKKKTDKYLIFTSKEANQDIFDMYENLKALKDIVLDYGAKLSKAKKEKNMLDFNDIEHFALNILVKEQEGKIEQTEVAKKYQEKFVEIAIDEYQDSNLLQEYILSSISRNNNMFMVGDVKQSIYKFRQARPDLFYTKYNNYKLKQNKTENDDLKIQLFKNFRSRKNILDFTNIIFENLMTENPWELEYNEEEYLNLGADYKEINQDLKIEINAIDLSEEDLVPEQEVQATDVGIKEDGEIYLDSEEEEHIEDVELEARYVAKRIKELIESNYQVYDVKKQEFRAIKYKDISVLLRSTKTSAPIYEKELVKEGIPVFSDSSSEYIGSIEIQTIMSLLRVIDNPLQDIPLVTVLRSSIANFTDNDLIQIRLNDQYENFYNAMLKTKLTACDKLKDKIEKFLNNIEAWRKAKEYLSLDELIWRIYVETGYYNYVGLMSNGALRQANLKMLFERAKQYERASFKGLFNFINFIEKIHLGSGDLGSAKIISENEDVVRIMSIHKSKGLEFPVVFLSNTGKSINLMDLKQNILLHNEIGIGTKYIDYNMQIEYDTLTKSAISNKLMLEAFAEEMRVLYVALTRAKEKLIITGIYSNAVETLEKMEEQITRYPKNIGKINPILIKKYKKYLDWMILVYKYNESIIKDICSFNIINRKQIKTKSFEQETNIEEILQKLKKWETNKIQYENIQKMLKYKYPDILLSTIPTKASVSKLKEKKSEEELVNFEKIIVNKNTIEQSKNDFPKPKFLSKQEEKITSAQKGTLLHLCMQKLDTSKDYTLQDIKDLLSNMRLKNQITNQQLEAINVNKIYKFTQNEMWQRMKKAKTLQKEKAFYINIPIKEIYKQDCDLQGDILVQGIIDLYFIDENDKLVLLDYKTDYVEVGQEEGLIDKYKVQLDLYKNALEEALKRKVDEVYIYSTYLDKTI